MLAILGHGLWVALRGSAPPLAGRTVSCDTARLTANPLPSGLRTRKRVGASETRQATALALTPYPRLVIVRAPDVQGRHLNATVEPCTRSSASLEFGPLTETGHRWR